MNSSRFIQSACPSVCVSVFGYVCMCSQLVNCNVHASASHLLHPPPSFLFSELYKFVLLSLAACRSELLLIFGSSVSSFLLSLSLSFTCLQSAMLNSFISSLSFFNLTFVLTKRVIQTLPSHYIRTSALLTKRREKIETETRTRQ